VSVSAEVLVRNFLGAWVEPRAEEIGSFFAKDAVWLDGPQGVRQGRQSITDELMNQLRTAQPMRVEILTLVAAGPTVMVEWRGSGQIAGRPISTRVMAAFEIDEAGLIRRFSECYDLQSMSKQVAEG
jgi:limonene-1,2-epoxide hydrolase